MKRYARIVLVGLIAVLLLVFGLSAHQDGMAQAVSKPLAAADLIQMKTSGFDDPTIVNAIAANGVALDTSVQGMTALKQAGLSDQVISAALAAAAPKHSAEAAPDSGLPDEVGAYIQTNEQLKPLPVEIVNFKTAGTLGMAFSYGLKKAKIQGTVTGEKSPAQLTLPLTIVLRCADGSAPTEYQLVQMDPKKDAREFNEAKYGLTGAKAGVDNHALKFDRIGHNTYKASVAGLNKGEYGFLAPGTAVSSTAASAGKIYSFGIAQ